MELSIIIPAYNSEREICNTLESIYNCINSGDILVEVIVIDDGSTDSTSDVVKDNFPCAKLVKQENKGPGGARNSGIKVAKGRYLWFVDSDDRISENSFITLKPHLDAGFDIIDFNYIEFTLDNKPIKRESIPSEISMMKEEERKKFLIYNCGRIWSKLIRRDYWEKLNVSYPENTIYEDNQIAALISSQAKSLKKISEPLYFYSYNPVSITKSQVNNRDLQRINTSKGMVNEFKKRGLYENFKPEIDHLFFVLFCYNTILTLSRGGAEYLNLSVSLTKEFKDLVGLKFIFNKYLLKVNKLHFFFALSILISGRVTVYSVHALFNLKSKFKKK
ncbi:glycosyltransferase family 2 protein [Vibrio sp. 10N.222.55.C12]|uniref:glycosyltransferase family 2 protein n=1 Tax=Vibrio sp. 10N.222.55.C12 TaxID=1884470 RepID=UPI000C835617|nr:glycosyltransferase family 2 protein [Vibrio sp. 10N.222.55.C12]PMN96594.1 hypothetical protein BCT20_02190 [Vibrio sp. 10N.222.55.C12]